ncbi:MAG: SDR family oxidoreductase [Clostridia bacterium]|nr:SDR family oxidoreductase [Clostridia bacterium]
MRMLNGKTAIVTGANSGMGMATSAALADMGAVVIMLCRNEKRGKEALNQLMEKAERKLDLMLCDLGDLSSVNTFADMFRAKYERLDILVNNAGFISLDRQITKDGFERQFGVNHLGHFLLTLKLADLIPCGGRIVNVSSGAHKTGKIHFGDINLTKGFNVIKAYSQSKLANVLFTRELAIRMKKRGIAVNCCHPGAVATNIGISRDTGFGKTVTGMLKPFFQTPEQGARTAIFLASDNDVGRITGEYFYKCRIARSSSRSKDMELARRLFEFSEELVEYKSSLSRP